MELAVPLGLGLNAQQPSLSINTVKMLSVICSYKFGLFLEARSHELQSEVDFEL